MLARLREAGLPVLRCCAASSAEQVRAFLGQVGGYPIVGKPDAAWTTTEKLDSDSELDAFFMGKPEGTYLFEEWLPGEAVSYDAVTDSAGEPLFESTTVWPHSIANLARSHGDMAYFTCAEIPEELRELGRREVKALNARSRLVHLRFLHVAKYQEKPVKQDFCSAEDHGGAVHRSLHAVMHLIEDHAKAAGIPVRFAAAKLLEGDSTVQKALRLDRHEDEMLEHIARQMEAERGLDRAAAIAEMRFAFIEKVVAQTVVKPRESKERERSRRIDRVLTGKYTAIPAFIGIMALVFWLTFGVIGALLQDLLANGIDALTLLADTAMEKWKVFPALRSLVVDGVFTGVGSVLSFLPIIVTLFFFLSLLEDTGYMARIAFVMDKLLRKIGLSGRSVVPMLIGFGCTVPAVMSSRTLPSERDRKMTIMMTPFMSCSAKLPIYGFFTAAFFPQYGWLVMVLLYLTGIVVGVLTALISKKTVFRGEAVPFVMELPNYRLPSPRSVGQLLWEKAKDFLQRAFSIIFLATIIIWFLQHFDLGFNLLLEDSEMGRSILATAAGAVAPIFRPLGYGDWRFSTALMTGFLAKESVVATLNILFGGAAGIQAALSPLSAASLLVFCLLYTPCVAAVASVKRELGANLALFTVLFQCAVAWVCALLVHLLGTLLLTL